MDIYKPMPMCVFKGIEISANKYYRLMKKYNLNRFPLYSYCYDKHCDICYNTTDNQYKNCASCDWDLCYDCEINIYNYKYIKKILDKSKLSSLIVDMIIEKYLNIHKIYKLLKKSIRYNICPYCECELDLCGINYNAYDIDENIQLFCRDLSIPIWRNKYYIRINDNNKNISLNFKLKHIDLLKNEDIIYYECNTKIKPDIQKKIEELDVDSSNVKIHMQLERYKAE